MKDMADIVKHLALVTQFGLSLITPLLLCLGLSWRAFSKLPVGGWIFIPGFFFGLGGSAMVAYKLYLQETRRQEKEKKEDSVHISFNQHL